MSGRSQRRQCGSDPKTSGSAKHRLSQFALARCQAIRLHCSKATTIYGRRRSSFSNFATFLPVFGEPSVLSITNSWVSHGQRSCLGCGKPIPHVNSEPKLVGLQIAGHPGPVSPLSKSMRELEAIDIRVFSPMVFLYLSTDCYRATLPNFVL